MTDFFDRLEADLHEAAVRSPRVRLIPPPAAVGATSVVVLSVVALLLVFGGGDRRHVADEGTGPGLSPVGTVIPKGAGSPPRSETSMVVARGDTAVGGPWQLEVFRYHRAKGPRSREPFMRAGKCLMLYLPASPGGGRPGLGGYCGPGNLGFRKTPGFSRQQTIVPPRGGRGVVIFGRAPKRASKIVVTAPGVLRIVVDPQPAPPGFRKRFGFDAAFYAVGLRARKPLPGARVNWLDASGRPGSRGIRLMPPFTPQRH
jgi:hypothetical protein